MGWGSRRVRRGQVVAVPLPYGGFAVAVLVSHNVRHDVGVFRVFGPRQPAVPTTVPVLANETEVHVAISTTMMVTHGEWPVLGVLPNLDPAIWGQTEFLRPGPDPAVENLGTVVRYDPADPAAVVDERAASLEDALLPEDGWSGWEFFRYRVDEALLVRERADPAFWGRPTR